MSVFKATQATHKIFTLRKRLRCVSGGTSASKTISILIWLIDYCQATRNEICSVVSESMPHLKRGAIRDFIAIMQDAGYFKDASWNKTDFIYTFETGSRLEFFSVEQSDKVRGPRRDVLFINEANNISYETYTQLEIRTKKCIWLDWNPVSEFWYYTNIQRLGVPHDFITLTYKDNETLDPRIVAAIEARQPNKMWWQVYGLGQLGDVTGRIYHDWKVIQSVPHEARLERYGLDFGYTNDPTAIVAVYKYNGGYILDQKAYTKKLDNKQIADILKNFEQSIVVADSAEPKSIAEIGGYGLPIIGASKGADSIVHGIQYVQQQRISVTEDSVDLLMEYRRYMWLVDKDDKSLNKPAPGDDHCFIGRTLITTDHGDIKIKDIRVGDRVMTSKGFRKVLRVWNNGTRSVYKYSLQFDTKKITLTCTADHKIQVGGAWKKISQLQSGDMVSLSNLSMVHCSHFGPENDTSWENIHGCMFLFGNTITEVLKKVFRYITKTVIRGIIVLKTWNSKRQTNTYQNTQEKDSQTIRTLQKSFSQKERKPLPHGIALLKASNGTDNTESTPIQKEYLFNVSVNNAGKFIRQKPRRNQNSVTQIVKLLRFDVDGSRNETVYDLTVEDTHEYFANGVLVHNCMDALRYALVSTVPDLEAEVEVPDWAEEMPTWASP